MIQRIKDLRSTEKGKALFKLGLYFTFFFFVMLLCVVAGRVKGPHAEVMQNESKMESKREVESHEEKELTYFEKQELFDGKYNFEHTISLGEKKINFVGEYDRGLVDGFKEDGKSLIHFKIEQGISYKVELFEKEPIDDLFDGMDESLFDFKALFKILNGSSATIVRDGDDKTYNYTIGDNSYEVVAGKKFIKKIKVTAGNDVYEFGFEF